MGDALGEGVFQNVAERAVADVVHEDGQFGTQHLISGHRNPFDFQHLESAGHEIQRPEHVAESGVHGARVDQRGEAQLLDAAVALEEWMRQDIEDNVIVDGEEPVVDGIVDYLPLVGHNKNIKRASSPFIAPPDEKKEIIDSTSKNHPERGEICITPYKQVWAVSQPNGSNAHKLRSAVNVKQNGKASWMGRDIVSE